MKEKKNSCEKRPMIVKKESMFGTKQGDKMRNKDENFDNIN